MTLHEVSEAANIIQEAADPDANIIFGTVIDRAMQGTVKVTVIATGFVRDEPRRPCGPRPPWSAARGQRRPQPEAAAPAVRALRPPRCPGAFPPWKSDELRNGRSDEGFTPNFGR